MSITVVHPTKRDAERTLGELVRSASGATRLRVVVVLQEPEVEGPYCGTPVPLRMELTEFYKGCPREAIEL